MEARADWVVRAFKYEVFKGEYQDVFMKLNEGGG